MIIISHKQISAVFNRSVGADRASEPRGMVSRRAAPSRLARKHRLSPPPASADLQPGNYKLAAPAVSARRVEGAYYAIHGMKLLRNIFTLCNLQKMRRRHNVVLKCLMWL
ncbi:hypothetical protein EVAR_49868_1 [Eumeta japonica]|uniref:Uncharacterized protein n=1 Tax=Eumeta variegata TaxID=151549 RepID=A0A4C1XWQ9_EUMVA|nr:hypothetical protein EVAR_49868_1 [Eumeta japonica]